MRMRKLLLAALALMLFLGFQSIWVHGFVSSTPPPPPPPPTSSPPIAILAEASSPSPGAEVARDENNNAHLQKKILIGLTVVATSLATLLMCIICLWIWRGSYSNHKSSAGNKHSLPCTDVEKGLNVHPVPTKRATSVGKKKRVPVIEYEILESGTNGFCNDAILGHGRLGSVYRACLEDDSLVAVKRFNAGDTTAERQCQNEMKLLSRVQHPNIIALRAYCAHEDARLLVYEFMPNGSLDTQLHGASRGCALCWHTRIKIALDTARGLEYLHEHCSPQVIHRDLKSSNILLDSKFNAKLTGFDTAVKANEAQYADSIQMSATPGYVAPEYLLDGKQTEKSDVYAFGVILLELLFGRKSVEELSPGLSQSIVAWAIPQLTDRSKLPNIVDPVIKDTMDLKHLYQVAAVAVLCVQQEPSYRPLITDVLHSLVPLVPAEIGGSGRASYTTHYGSAT
ncbi:hypothetical protein QQ045_024689 [Rhodiola kirilowii]